jgi:branched-chain amino acid transport system permease protein
VVRWVAVAVVVIAAVVLPLVLPEVANDNLARVGVFAVAVLGLNVVMGYGGQVSLGQIFFLGLGAYTAAYGATHGWNIVVVLVASILIPAVVGLLIALVAARLGGLAIAMLTIALPIIGVPLAKRMEFFTGGPQGVSTRFFDAPVWSGLYNDQFHLYLVLVVGAIVFLLVRNLVRGKYGRALAIVKENEAVAGAMGISSYWTKVLAFTVASLVGGVSGFLYMSVLQYTSPETLSFGHSITLVASMVVGGAATMFGSVLGGLYYIFVPILTNAIDPNLTALLQGLIMLVVLVVLPGGLASLPARIRSLKHRKAPPSKPLPGPAQEIGAPTHT